METVAPDLDKIIEDIVKRVEEDGACLKPIGMDFISVIHRDDTNQEHPLQQQRRETRAAKCVSLLNALLSTAENAQDSKVSALFKGSSGSGKSSTIQEICHAVPLVAQQGSALSQDLLRKLENAHKLLRLFGNAKTAMNDDSTRLCSVTELRFDRHRRFINVKIRYYLPDTSRSAPSYHGTSSLYRILDQYDPTNPETCELSKLCRELHFPEGAIQRIHAMLKGVLAIHVMMGKDDDGRRVWARGDYEAVALALGMDEDDLSSWINECKPPQQAEKQFARWKSLSVGLYGLTFQFLGDLINNALDSSQNWEGEGDKSVTLSDDGGEGHVTVKLLDTLGKEWDGSDATQNGYDQFRINTLNDNLHGEYIRRRMTELFNAYQLEGVPVQLNDMTMPDDTVNLAETLGSFRQALNSLVSGEPMRWLERCPDLLTQLQYNKKAKQIDYPHHFGSVRYDIGNWYGNNRAAHVSTLLKSSTVLASFHSSDIERCGELANSKTVLSLDIAAEKEFMGCLTQEIAVVHCLAWMHDSMERIGRGDGLGAGFVKDQLCATGLMGCLEIYKSGFPIQKSFEELELLCKPFFDEIAPSNKDDIPSRLAEDVLINAEKTSIGLSITDILEDVSKSFGINQGYYIGKGKVFMKDEVWGRLGRLARERLAAQIEVKREEEKKRLAVAKRLEDEQKQLLERAEAEKIVEAMKARLRADEEREAKARELQSKKEDKGDDAEQNDRPEMGREGGEVVDPKVREEEVVRSGKEISQFPGMGDIKLEREGANDGEEGDEPDMVIVAEAELLREEMMMREVYVGIPKEDEGDRERYPYEEESHDSEVAESAVVFLDAHMKHREGEDDMQREREKERKLQFAEEERRYHLQLERQRELVREEEGMLRDDKGEAGKSGELELLREEGMSFHTQGQEEDKLSPMAEVSMVATDGSLAMEDVEDVDLQAPAEPFELAMGKEWWGKGRSTKTLDGKAEGRTSVIEEEMEIKQELMENDIGQSNADMMAPRSISEAPAAHHPQRDRQVRAASWMSRVRGGGGEEKERGLQGVSVVEGRSAPKFENTSGGKGGRRETTARRLTSAPTQTSQVSAETFRRILRAAEKTKPPMEVLREKIEHFMLTDEGDGLIPFRNDISSRMSAKRAFSQLVEEFANLGGPVHAYGTWFQVKIDHAELIEDRTLYYRLLEGNAILWSICAHFPRDWMRLVDKMEI